MQEESSDNDTEFVPETVPCERIVGKPGRKRLCGKPVVKASIPVNQKLKTGALCQPLCPYHFERQQKQIQAARKPPKPAVVIPEGWISCIFAKINQGKRTVCGKPVDPATVRVNKHSRTGELLQPLCPMHRAKKDKDVKEKKRRYHESAEKRQKAADRRQTPIAKATASACNKRQARRVSGEDPEDPSAAAHKKIAMSFANMLRRKQKTCKWLERTDFGSARELRGWFDAEAKRCGFPGGLDDYGPGPGKWVVAHQIPKRAYDGTDAEELRKCWQRANVTCKTKSANSSQACHFDEALVPAELWPVDWNGVPPTAERRAQIVDIAQAWVEA
jgi:hypothetical protein